MRAVKIEHQDVQMHKWVFVSHQRMPISCPLPSFGLTRNHITAVAPVSRHTFPPKIRFSFANSKLFGEFYPETFESVHFIITDQTNATRDTAPGLNIRTNRHIFHVSWNGKRMLHISAFGLQTLCLDKDNPHYSCH